MNEKSDLDSVITLYPNDNEWKNLHSRFDVCFKITELIDAGAEPTAQTLDLAINTGNISIILCVIKAGGKPTAQSLDLAIKTENPEIVKKVIEVGAKPTQQSLDLAIQTGEPETVNLVVGAGAQCTPEALDKSIAVGLAKNGANLFASPFIRTEIVKQNARSLQHHNQDTDSLFSRIPPEKLITIASMLFFKSEYISFGEADQNRLEKIAFDVLIDPDSFDVLEDSPSDLKK